MHCAGFRLQRAERCGRQVPGVQQWVAPGAEKGGRYRLPPTFAARQRQNAGAEGVHHLGSFAEPMCCGADEILDRPERQDVAFITSRGFGSGSVEGSRRVSEPLPDRMRSELG